MKIKHHLSELTYTASLEEQTKRYVLIKTSNGRASFWRRIRREMTTAGMMELHQSANSQIIDLANLLRFDLGA
jgi:hypothetical protein